MFIRVRFILLATAFVTLCLCFCSRDHHVRTRTPAVTRLYESWCGTASWTLCEVDTGGAQWPDALSSLLGLRPTPDDRRYLILRDDNTSPFTLGESPFSLGDRQVPEDKCSLEPEASPHMTLQVAVVVARPARI